MSRESRETFVIMPFVDLWGEYTLDAAEDILRQSVPVRLLLVSNGSGDEDKNAALDWLAHRERGEGDNVVHLWHYRPALTLSQVWNRGLDLVWRAGGERALVVNNDLRLHPLLLERLCWAMDQTGALFVSAVNVAKQVEVMPPTDLVSRGGPDFSCFLISREGHQKYRFDDQFTYCNDLDYHRRMMLGGDGLRIFSVNIPYMHFASRTIQRHPGLADVADGHRKLYAEKWGGGVNEEKWWSPYQPPAFGDKAITTTPELQQQNREGRCCDKDSDADGSCAWHPRRS